MGLSGMAVSGIAEVSARVASIEQQMTSSASFAAALTQATPPEAETAETGTETGREAGTQSAAGTGAAVMLPNGAAVSGLNQNTLAAYLFNLRLGVTDPLGAATATQQAVPPEASAGVAASGTVPGVLPATGAAPSGDWVALLPAAGKPWAGAIQSAATQAGIDPRLLAAIARAESGFNPQARSGVGAIGMTQLMPGTAASLGVDPTDPVANLAGGARYIATQLHSFGRTDLAVAAYNAGPGAVAKAGGIPNYPETQAYVQRVLGYYKQLGGTL